MGLAMSRRRMSIAVCGILGGGQAPALHCSHPAGLVPRLEKVNRPVLYQCRPLSRRENAPRPAELWLGASHIAPMDSGSAGVVASIRTRPNRETGAPEKAAYGDRCRAQTTARAKSNPAR